ncbi:hypothetical protein [Rhodococcus aetherivorans]|uniref:hypothetical protein n=1 Tax=Rhodococcus aetherivorans TaxID=191292 RepID=UPI0012DC37DC|nr:hypothetical protein [Rhodococcus aetherivorans]
MASQLRDGEVLWANVVGTDVLLGSGQPLHVPTGVPDGLSGWRRVRIVDATTLTAEVIALPVTRPFQDIGDEPATLFAPLPHQPPPHRPPGFPAGEGGDLTAAFEARVARAKDDYERRIADSVAQAERCVRDAEDRSIRARDMARREGEQIRRDAEQRIQQFSSRVRAESDARVAEAYEAAKAQYKRAQSVSAELAQSRNDLDRAIAEARDLTTRLQSALNDRQRMLTAATIGWLVVMVMFALLIFGS